jgi:hypothetical protein
MSMQSLRTTNDAQEFETRLRALRNTQAGANIDAIDFAEIATMRNRIDEIDNIVQAMRKPTQWTRLTASTAEIAITATEKYAELQGHQTDCATENDGSIDAWGWHPGDDSESEMIWRVRIRITEGAK